jgi:hypothetical protein
MNFLQYDEPHKTAAYRRFVGQRALPPPPSPLGSDAQGGDVPFDREHQCYISESTPLSGLQVAAVSGHGVSSGPPGCPPPPLPAGGGGCPFGHAHVGTGPGSRRAVEAPLHQRMQWHHHQRCCGAAAPAGAGARLEEKAGLSESSCCWE